MKRVDNQYFKSWHFDSDKNQNKKMLIVCNCNETFDCWSPHVDYLKDDCSNKVRRGIGKVYKGISLFLERSVTWIRWMCSKNISN